MAFTPGGTAPDIVTSRFVHDDSHTLDRYLATGGYNGLRKALSMTPEQVVEEVTTSNILGRGGAGFEAGRKWSMLRKADTRYLVVNGDEGEPSTFKDHGLIERDPHQLIEGVLIAAYAIQATQAFIYLRGEFALGAERVQAALNEAYAYGAVGKSVLGSSYGVDIVVHLGAGAYIVGDETALIESLEGNRAFPRLKPPNYPAVIGLYGEPTIVNNVETLSNLPWILEHGGAAFAALGVGRSTGTRIFSLSGHVERPGAYEVEMVKTTFRHLIYDKALGGGVKGGRELKAIVPGGTSAPWFGPQHLDVPLGQNEAGEAQGVLPEGGGTMLGSGAVIVMDETTCAVRAAWRITKFYAHESCGQCTPCREGGSWFEKTLERIEHGSGRVEDLDLLLDGARGITPKLQWPPAFTTICQLGPSIPMAFVSAIHMFRDEFLAHINGGGCHFPGRAH